VQTGFVPNSRHCVGGAIVGIGRNGSGGDWKICSPSRIFEVLTDWTSRMRTCRHHQAFGSGPARLRDVDSPDYAVAFLLEMVLEVVSGFSQG